MDCPHYDHAVAMQAIVFIIATFSYVMYASWTGERANNGYELSFALMKTFSSNADNASIRFSAYI